MAYKDPEKRRAYNIKYRQENKEKIKALRRKYYEENKEKILANGKKYRGENKEKIADQRKKYRQENKEKWKKQYERDKEKILAQRKKQYQENKEKFSARNKKYYEENKEAKKAYVRNRYKKKSAENPSVIYMIECKATNKYYIGQTSSWFEERIRIHRSSFNRRNNTCGIGMQEDYNIHGPDAFEYSMLKELSPDASEEELLAAEKECINNFIKEGKELYNKEYSLTADNNKNKECKNVE